jgi:hypothetical protein
VETATQQGNYVHVLLNLGSGLCGHDGKRQFYGVYHMTTSLTPIIFLKLLKSPFKAFLALFKQWGSQAKMSGERVFDLGGD